MSISTYLYIIDDCNLYDQICPNPQSHKTAKDNKHNSGKKGNKKKHEKNKKEIHQLPTSCMYPNLILLGSPKI
jgi:hypothetical protein